MDHALGYTRSGMGRPRIHNPLLRATRVQTLAISSTLTIGLSHRGRVMLGVRLVVARLFGFG